ncbi:uncharacterized protein LOC117107030 isoform X2 [Anneissia japonica]|nr:uncharacterized protein LOC117107030 isoform X2 [Anneissia japonica]
MCVSMLKVLYSDHVQNHFELHNCSKTRDIIGLLIRAGHLTPNDLTLLYETIKLTQQFGLEQLIKNRHPSFPVPNNITVITKFTLHRQKLVNLGMVLISNEIEQIGGLYSAEEEHTTDSWNLIMYLEQRMVICEGKMEAFIKNLKKHKHKRAEKVLTEDASAHGNPMKQSPMQTKVAKNVRSTKPLQAASLQQGDLGDVTKVRAVGVSKLDVRADGKPKEQLPIQIKVERDGLVRTIQTNNKEVKDVVTFEDDCLLVSTNENLIYKYKQSGEDNGKVTLPKV